MDRGMLTGTPPTGISGTPVREMDWTLDPTGNWPAYLTKTNGTTDLDQTRMANVVNEITAIGGTPSWADPIHDVAGNTISFPKAIDPTTAFTAKYDAWNRMVWVKNGSDFVAKYKYDGRGKRYAKKSYASGSLSETRHFYFTNDWQDIEERLGTSPNIADPALQYVWGIRYVDELVCRDDSSPQRLYACQDANFNLTAVTDTSGTVIERYVFTPYGTRTIMNTSWSSISSSAFEWEVGHQGLMYEDSAGLIYNRARWLNPLCGAFLNRDPVQYADGLSLYQYVGSRVTRHLDWAGLAAKPSITLCIGYGKTLNPGDPNGTARNQGQTQIDTLNSLLKYCREQYKVDVPDATIANKVPPTIDDSDRPEVNPGRNRGDADYVQKLIDQIPDYGNKRCIKVLFSGNRLGGDEIGWGRPGGGIIMNPQPGDPEDWGTLAHECGHVAEYDCGDAAQDKSHSTKPGNTMYRGNEDPPAGGRMPDKCWCKKMADLANRE